MRICARDLILIHKSTLTRGTSVTTSANKQGVRMRWVYRVNSCWTYRFLGRKQCWKLCGLWMVVYFCDKRRCKSKSIGSKPDHSYFCCGQRCLSRSKYKNWDSSWTQIDADDKLTGSTVGSWVGLGKVGDKEGSFVVGVKVGSDVWKWQVSSGQDICTLGTSKVKSMILTGVSVGISVGLVEGEIVSISI